MEHTMNSTTAPTTFTLPHGTPASARSVMRLLQNLRHGSLTLQLPDGSMQRFGKGDLPHATLSLHNWNVFSAALKSRRHRLCRDLHRG
jgi:cyclopropane-fatty-acyl-phospholipid synthase